MKHPDYKDYGWVCPDATHMHAHFLPHLFALAANVPPGGRVLDVGCGNGFSCGEFLKRGFRVVGLDTSEYGITLARKTYPQARFEVVPADSQILANLNEPPFDLVISTEVIEHIYDPRGFARGCFGAVKPGGRFICSTPYHGYLKNLALAVAGRWDTHANPLWDHGHIKLWSRRTLSSLLTEVGFRNLQFRGAGRLPYLWMTMIMSGDRPT